jgi:hypothetical protein
LLPSRPVYLASMAHGGKKNIITIGMFAFFSGTPSLVGIGISLKRYSALYEGFGWARFLIGRYWRPNTIGVYTKPYARLKKLAKGRVYRFIVDLLQDLPLFVVKRNERKWWRAF